MPVTTLHPLYEDYIQRWTKCRDAFDGQQAIKSRGSAYLPRLSGQDESEYDSYLNRAVFYNATARTVQALTGSVFRKAPEKKVPASIKNLDADIGAHRESFDSIAREVLREILVTGRVGVYVDSRADENSDPYIALYYTENIVNWRTADIDGVEKLVLVVLRESTTEGDSTEDIFESDEVVRYRVLRLVMNEAGKVEYIVQIYEKGEETDGEEDNEDNYVLSTTVTPRRKGGKTFEEIPFCFGTPIGISNDIQKLPLLDLVELNISHYMNSADLEHGRHFTALPTPYVTGVNPEKTKLKIGSTTAWALEDPTSKVGFLEFAGAGLKSLSDALKEKEHNMAVLGARLLEQDKNDAEAAETVRMRKQGEGSALADIATAVGETLTQALKWIGMWIGMSDSETADILVKMNKDFGASKLTPTEITALMTAYLQGAFPYEVLHYNFQRGEIIPEGQTVEETRQMIELSPIPGLQPDPNNPNPNPSHKLVR